MAFEAEEMTREVVDRIAKAILITSRTFQLLFSHTYRDDNDKPVLLLSIQIKTPNCRGIFFPKLNFPQKARHTPATTIDSVVTQILITVIRQIPISFSKLINLLGGKCQNFINFQLRERLFFLFYKSAARRSWSYDILNSIFLETGMQSIELR